MGDLVKLPLQHGSYRYLSLRMTYTQGEGWSLHAVHAHEGEKNLCEGKSQYEGLAVDELVDVVASVVCVAHERFLADGDGCHVQLRLL